MGRAYQNRKESMAKTAAAKTKVYSKYGREIYMAAKAGGIDPQANLSLRGLIERAKKDQVPTHVIEKAIDKAKGGAGEDYAPARYEGYGPGGVAIFVEVMTDNKNRSVAEIRHAFNKMGGNLGTDGSVAYLFSKQGIISYGPEWEEDRLVEAVLSAGAEDLAAQDDGSWEIVTTPEQFLDVKESLVNAGLVPDNAEVTMVPSTRVELDRDGAETILKLIDMLEDLDDVQNVYHNADISGDIMESL